MATKRGKAKKKNPCWKGYTAMGSDGQIVMKKKGDKMVPACRPIKDGASMKGKRKAIKELDKKSGEKVKTDKKGNVKKLTMTREPGTLNESVETYKGGHVNAKSETSYTKNGKNSAVTRTIDGTINKYGGTGKKGKTVVKNWRGKTVHKTNKKGITTTKEKPKRKYK